MEMSPTTVKIERPIPPAESTRNGLGNCFTMLHPWLTDRFTTQRAEARFQTGEER